MHVVQRGAVPRARGVVIDARRWPIGISGPVGDTRLTIRRRRWRNPCGAEFDAAILPRMMLVYLGGFFGMLLALGGWVDWRTRRRGGTVRSAREISAAAVDGRRDAEGAGPFVSDVSWTSWSRRNHQHR